MLTILGACFLIVTGGSCIRIVWDNDANEVDTTDSNSRMEEVRVPNMQLIFPGLV